MSPSTNTHPESQWRILYRLGGIAPFLTLTFYISQFAFIRWEVYPTSTESWFRLFQQSRLLGLFYLNALDILSITLLGVMFLALYHALKNRNPSLMALAAFFAFLGVTSFIIPRIAMLSIMTLSGRYAQAATEAERLRLLAAGEALGALGTPTPQTFGFFFLSVGVLLASIVMLQTKDFSKVTAWVGILASVLTFTDDLSLLLAPNLAPPLMIASGIFWIPWWVLISVGLLRLAKASAK